MGKELVIIMNMTKILPTVS